MFFIWFSVFFCFAFSYGFFFPMVFLSIFKTKCSWYLKNNHHFSWLLSKYFHMRFRKRLLIESLFSFFTINRKPNSKIFPNVIVNVASLNDVFVSNQKYGFCRQTFFSDKKNVFSQQICSILGTKKKFHIQYCLWLPNASNISDDLLISLVLSRVYRRPVV